MGFSLKSLSLRKHRHLGMAISEEWISLARVEARGDGFYVADSRSLPMASIDKLSGLLTDMGAVDLPATLALQDDRFTLRTLNLPKLSPAEMKKVVKREVAVEAREGRLASWSITEDGNDDTVTLRALERDVALSWTRRIKEAGQRPHQIVPHATAFCSAALPPGEQRSDELISLLDIWDHHTDLVLIRGGVQVYHRRIGRGWSGTQYDADPAKSTAKSTAKPPTTGPPRPTAQADPSAAMQESGSDYGNVDLAALALNMPTDTATPPATPAAPAAAQAEGDVDLAALNLSLAPGVKPKPREEDRERANPAWERLAEEIRRTHLFAKKNLNVGDVARTVLTGPMNDVRRRWIDSAIGMETVPLPEYRTDITWENDFDPRHTVAVGAAVRGLSPSQPHERLVPVEMVQRNTSQSLATAASALIVCLFALAAFGVYSEATANTAKQAHVKKLERQLAALQSQPHVTRETDHSALEQALLQTPAPFPGSALLAVMGHTLPGNAELSFVGAEWHDRWQVEVEGRINATPVTSLRLLGRMVTDLQNSGLFSRVTLMPVTNGDAATPFKLQLTLGESRVG